MKRLFLVLALVFGFAGAHNAQSNPGDIYANWAAYNAIMTQGQYPAAAYGQMPYYGPSPLEVAMAANWSGAQPLGLGSMMPPIGMEAILNRAAFTSGPAY